MTFSRVLKVLLATKTISLSRDYRRNSTNNNSALLSLERVQDAGVTLNRNKCQFSVILNRDKCQFDILSNKISQGGLPHFAVLSWGREGNIKEGGSGVYIVSTRINTVSAQSCEHIIKIVSKSRKMLQKLKR